MPKTVIYKPSPKMCRVWREKDSAKYRWLEGAVRSSKTFVANDIAIHELQQLPPCNVLLSGYSISTVARNVIAEWRKLIDPYERELFRNVRDTKDDYLIIDWRGLRDKKFYVRGAGKENDYKAIQGGTFGYWYGDEMTRHHKSFTDMAMTRLSPPFALAIGTTNPDSPFHYFKTDVLDKERLYVEDDHGFSLYKRWTFYLRDNPSLSDDFIRSLENTYSGVFYKRYILSQWVVAEGSVYDLFDYDCHTYDGHIPTRFHAVGIDYATSSVMCFILFGIDLDPRAKRKCWAIREFIWDAQERGKQKTDVEFSADLKAWLGGIIPYKIIIDPSATSFKVQLRKDGFPPPVDADNDIVNGIRTQARMLKSGEYIVGRDCKRTILDYGGYSWEEKAQLRGEDVPAAGPAEHTKDVERYVLQTLWGEYFDTISKLTTW